MKPAGDKALVLLSGGQDSTTCLYWAMDRFGRDNVAALSFDYGQRHRIELECAQAIAKDADVAHTILPVDTFSALGGDALTDPGVEVGQGVEEASGLPNTFVPGRNLIFLTLCRGACLARRHWQPRRRSRADRLQWLPGLS